MGKENRGIRDGTGAYKESFRVKEEGKTEGRRAEAGEECPIKKNIKKSKDINW